MTDRQASDNRHTYRGRQADRLPPPSRGHGPLNRRAAQQLRGKRSNQVEEIGLVQPEGAVAKAYHEAHIQAGCLVDLIVFLMSDVLLV